MKIDYENLKPSDLEEEEIKIEFDKNVFKGPLTCTKCNLKLKKTITDFDLPGGAITLHLEAYKCAKCGKEYLSEEQAEKFDNMLVLIDAIKKQPKLKFERVANYDGKNWFIRFPIDLTRSWHRKMITDIIPITNRDYFIHVKERTN